MQHMETENVGSYFIKLPVERRKNVDTSKGFDKKPVATIATQPFSAGLWHQSVRVIEPH